MSNEVHEQMREAWNERAREDAHYYVAFGSRDQDEEGFLATAADAIRAFKDELKRLPPSPVRARRALEIGCGPGRLMKPLSQFFGEIHGVDVSDEMIRLARERLRSIPHAHAHVGSGAGLPQFASSSFDLVFSYAVYQHIPSRPVVLEYMRETFRVLKPGGIFRGQFNGLAASILPDTWRGVSFSGEDIKEFTRSIGLQLLALDGVGTQYMWTTWRKPDIQPRRFVPARPTSIRGITNAFTSEPLVPNRGRCSAISLWIDDLPGDGDINNLNVRVESALAEIFYVGTSAADGLMQINAWLPANTRTGLIPVQLFYNGSELCPEHYVRVVPAGPLIPRVVNLVDGINLIEQNRTRTGLVKVHLEEVAYPDRITVTIDGRPVRNLEVMLTDPIPPRHELNFRVPEDLAPGRYVLQVRVGERDLLPCHLDVDASRG
jgi:SAM-dependent methyltransferase